MGRVCAGAWRVRVRFTGHARRKLELLRSLGVTEDAVLRVLMEPDELLYDTQRGRLIAVRYDQGLAVPFDREGDVITVVTVLYSSGLRRLVERRKRSGRWI